MRFYKKYLHVPNIVHTFASILKQQCFITKYRDEMKKVFLMLAVAFSMTMFSCTNNAEKAEEATTEEAPAVVEEVVEAAPEAVVDSANQVVGEVVEAAGEVVEAPAAE